jgi:hypothetical protein
MTTETKSFKMINFSRRITKIYYENAEMTYGEFASYIRKNGLGDRDIKDDEVIKRLWDELANSGDDHGDGVARVDTEQEKEYDNTGDDEEWDDDDGELWEFIENFNFDEDLPVCVVDKCSKDVSKEGEKCWLCVKKEKEEAEKTPEQKEKEAKELADWKAAEEKRAAEKKKQAEEFQLAATARWTAERTANAPKNILNAITTATEIFKVEPTTEEDEQWKIKAMRSVARLRILDQMKSLVAQLEEVGKW